MADAIKPDFFSNFPIVEKDEERKKNPTDEEKMLWGLSETSGWKILKGYIEEWMQELDAVNDMAIANGSTFEELGRNALVANLAKGIIKRIVNKVSDAKEACGAGGA